MESRQEGVHELGCYTEALSDNGLRHCERKVERGVMEANPE
jgi:hypothetical protein